jgi:unsaturated rhamnogalacturonyl hydrolase
MTKIAVHKMKPVYLLVFILFSQTLACFAQKTVGLDNWYNHESNPKTGKIFHYTWDDTAMSGFSQLGKLFEKQDAVLKTIHAKPNRQSMKEIDIYIIVDPDTTKENPIPNYIELQDVKFLRKWVNKGGVLLLMANDGPNCEFTHFNDLAKVFGFQFHPQTLNPVNNRQWEMAAETNLPDHPLFSGVKKIYMKEVAPISLSGNAKSVLTDKDSNSTFIAESQFGKGYVLAIGDPWLYNEYIDHWLLHESFENLKAANNLVELLLGKVN